MTVRMVAVEDCVATVRSAPDATALNRVETNRWSVRRKESPERPFRPSVRWWIPSRNRPIPPRSFTTPEVFMALLPLAASGTRSRKWHRPPWRSALAGPSSGSAPPMRRGRLPHALGGLEGNTLALVRSRFYHPAILVERQDVPAP